MLCNASLYFISIFSICPTFNVPECSAISLRQPMCACVCLSVGLYLCISVSRYANLLYIFAWQPACVHDSVCHSDRLLMSAAWLFACVIISFPFPFLSPRRWPPHSPSGACSASGSAHLREGAAVALQQFLALTQTRVVAIDGSPHVVGHFVHQLPVDVGVVSVVRVVVGKANMVPSADSVKNLHKYRLYHRRRG